MKGDADMEELISIIVPVYNVELYLSECLDSIIKQNYTRLEIILVDDGSTDNSGIICDSYAKKDKRIIVIHQKNGGAANAKNTGLRRASGTYLSFVDADDYVEPGTYAYMVSMMEMYQVDIVQGHFREIYIDKKVEHPSFTLLTLLNTEDYLKKYAQDWTCALLWDKLYKRHLFRGIFFEEGHIVDDEFFTYLGVMNAKKILQAPRIVYNYRKRKSSVTSLSSNKARTILDKLDYVEKRKNNIVNRYPELRSLFESQYLDMILILMRDPNMTEEGVYRIKEMLKRFFAENDHIRIRIPLLVRLKGLQYLPVKLCLGQKAIVLNEDQEQSDYFA